MMLSHCRIEAAAGAASPWDGSRASGVAPAAAHAYVESVGKGQHVLMQCFLCPSDAGFQSAHTAFRRVGLGLSYGLVIWTGGC